MPVLPKVATMWKDSLRSAAEIVGFPIAVFMFAVTIAMLLCGTAKADETVCGLPESRINAYRERIAQNADTIQTTLRRYNVSESFIWLAMVESGGDEDAESKRGAAGLWQLTRATAQHYGCQDRNNVVCSTRAAAQYLAKLLADFDGNVWKAIVGYNMGGTNYRRTGRPTNEATALANTVTCLMETYAYDGFLRLSRVSADRPDS